MYRRRSFPTDPAFYARTFCSNHSRSRVHTRGGVDVVKEAVEEEENEEEEEEDKGRNCYENVMYVLSADNKVRFERVYGEAVDW